MRKPNITYRFLTTWLLAAVFVNLLFPAAMEAAQLFCKDAPFVHSTGMHTSSSCWMVIGKNATQTDLNHDNCTLGQVCNQSIKTSLIETPVIQHQNLKVLGVPLTGSAFSTTLKESSKTVTVLSHENVIQSREIYLLNSTLLN